MTLHRLHAGGVALAGEEYNGVTVKPFWSHAYRICTVLRPDCDTPATEPALKCFCRGRDERFTPLHPSTGEGR